MTTSTREPVPGARAGWKTPAALFLGALALRVLFVVLSDFDGIYGRDAFTYLAQGRAFARLLASGHSLPPEAHWPNGYPLLVGLVALVTGASPLAGQVVSLLAGAALAPLVYLASRSLFPRVRHAALFGGLMAATAGQAMLTSVIVMSDAAAATWATCALWCLVRVWEGRRLWPWLVAAGASMAMAVITRWSYALLAPAMVTYALWQARRHGRPRVRSLLMIGLLTLVAAAPQILHGLTETHGLLTSALLVDWSPANAFRAEGGDGGAPNAIFYLAPLGHPAYLLPFFGLAALWALARLGLTPSTLLVGGWFLAEYVFLAGMPVQAFRFALALFTPAALLAGTGVALLSEHARWGRAVTIVALLGVLGTALWGWRMTSALAAREASRVERATELAAAVPENATLLTFDITATLAYHHPDVDVRGLDWASETALTGLLGSARPLYVAVDPDHLVTEWRDPTPGERFAWLERHARLEEVGRFPPFVLWSVVAP